MNVRRLMVNIRQFTPIHNIQEGDILKLRPIIKGENPVNDTLIESLFHLPKKIKVFHCNTDDLNLPINFIGGRETRLIGDTCRMFFRIKLMDRPTDYYIWDGIINTHLSTITDDKNGYIMYSVMDNQLEYISDPSLLQYRFGFATGTSTYRMVLTEKKAPCFQVSL